MELLSKNKRKNQREKEYNEFQTVKERIWWNYCQIRKKERKKERIRGRKNKMQLKLKQLKEEYDAIIVK